MATHQDHAVEVQQELVKLGLIISASNLISYIPIIGGGSDCMIFEFCFENPSMKFIQKIFRDNRDNQFAEFEYENHKLLFENKINVPQPYFLKLTPNSRDRPYFVMEKVEGLRLIDVKESNPEQDELLTQKLLLALYSIHSLDKNLFPTLSVPDIQDNPYALIDKKLERRKKYLEKYPEELNELKPVIDWLEKNKSNYPCTDLAVIHGDIHSYNILVQENQDLKMLDWTGIEISDVRMDICYAATSESYIGGYKQTSEERMKNASVIARMYEQISGTKIEGLAYFMILTCTYNLIRLYSQINNPTITDENEETKEFFSSVYDYFLFVTDIIKENCDVELKQIKEYFSV